MTTKQAYDYGYDCGKNGSNTTNSNYSIFSTNELAKWYGNGKRDAEAGLPPVDLTHPSVATTLPSAGELELKNIEAYSFDEDICQPIEASTGEQFKKFSLLKDVESVTSTDTIASAGEWKEETAEQKAKELVGKFKGVVWGNTLFTRKLREKQAALICVDEILNVNKQLSGQPSSIIQFYQQVRNEITKL